MTWQVGLLLLINLSALSSATADVQKIHSPRISELGLPNESERLSDPAGTYATQVETKIDTDGRPTECVVTGKSISEMADAAACSRIMRARFEIPRDAAGIAHPGIWKGWIASSGSTPETTSKFTAKRKRRIRAMTTYPPQALAERREGSADIFVTVSPEGRASSCEVVVSSGWSDLDEASCRQFIRSARFNPEMDNDGLPIESSFSTTMHWKLD
jgi:TonB family protein